MFQAEMSARDIEAGGDVGIGTTAPATKLEVNGTAQFGSGATKSTFTATGELNLSTGALLGGGFRVGAVEGVAQAINHLIQYSSATVTGDLTIDFTDAGLRDCGVVPHILLTPVFNSSDDNALTCTPHSVGTTGFTIECELASGDGVASANAADASAREISYLVACPAP